MKYPSEYTKMSNGHSQRMFQPDMEVIEDFLSRFEFQNYQALTAAEDNEQLKASLLGLWLPTSVINQIQQKIKPRDLKQETYTELVATLKATYSTQKSAIGASVQFIKRKQRENETIESYARSLNELGSQCEYSDCCRSRLLRDQFIAGLRSTRLITALITECEDKNFDQAVTRAKVLEQISADVEDIMPMRSGERVYLNKPQYPPRPDRHSRGFRTTYRNDRPSTQVDEKYVCIRCSARGKHLAKDCFALKLKCNKCSKVGHIAKSCKSKNTYTRNRANHIADVDRYNPPEELTLNDFITVNKIRTGRTTKKQGPPPTETNNRFKGLQEVEEEWPRLTDHKRHTRKTITYGKRNDCSRDNANGNRARPREVKAAKEQADRRNGKQNTFLGISQQCVPFTK